MGLWGLGQECQAPLAASTKLAVDVETERCCTVLGGRWQFLPMADNAHGSVVGVGLGDGGEAVE